MSLKFDISDMASKLASLENKTDAAIRVLAEQGAKKLESEAKNNARWTDRTGSARTRLNGSAGKIANGYRLTLAHGVDYGIWLELANEKRYSIIPETINYVGAFEIIPGFERFMERLG